MGKLTVKGNIGSIEKKTSGTGEYVMFSVGESIKPKVGGAEFTTQWHTCFARERLAQRLDRLASKGCYIEVTGWQELSVYNDKAQSTLSASTVLFLKKDSELDGANEKPADFTTNDISF